MAKNTKITVSQIKELAVIVAKSKGFILKKEDVHFHKQESSRRTINWLRTGNQIISLDLYGVDTGSPLKVLMDYFDTTFRKLANGGEGDLSQYTKGYVAKNTMYGPFKLSPEAASKKHRAEIRRREKAKGIL